MFREEVLQASSPTMFGRIMIEHTGASCWFAMAAAAFLLAIAAFLVLFGFSRKEVVYGALLPRSGLIRAYPYQPGVVAEKRVREGQYVERGDVLFVLTAERFGDAHGDTKALLTKSLGHRIQKLREEQAGRQRQVPIQQDTLARRKLAVDDQLAQIATEIELQGQRIALAEQSGKRQSELQKQGFVSESALQDNWAGLLEHRARLLTLERSRAALKADLLTLQVEALDTSARAQRELFSLEQSLTELEQGLAENEASRRFVVRAPQSGRVTALGAEPGQAVTPSVAMATILPENTQLEAELCVPSRAIGFVRPGELVLLRYHAFPFQKFGQFKARVREVSRSALATQELSDLLSKEAVQSEPFYRVRAVLEQQTVTALGNAVPLMPGMQLDASIVLEHRKIYEWILEPLLTITRRL